MSTFIKISGGQSALLQANQAQSAANRQAALERMSREKAGQQGKRERDARRKQEGLDKDGRVIFGVQPRPQPTSAPGVFLVSDTLPAVHGVGVKVTTGTTLPSGFVDWAVTISIGSFDGAQTTEFVIPYAATDFYKTAVPSGLPTQWTNVPLYVGTVSNAGYLDTTSSHIVAAGTDPNGTSSCARDVTIVTSVDLSKTILLPDGTGGTIIIYVLNRLHRRRVDRVTKVVETNYTIASTHRAVNVRPFPIERPNTYSVEWSTNPGCYDATVELPSAPGVGGYALSHYWAGTNTITATRTTVVNEEVKHYAIRTYKVANKTQGSTVTEIPTPIALDTWLRTLYPPIDYNTETPVTAATGVNANFVTPGTVVWSNSWDGSHGVGLEPCFPNIQAFDIRQAANTPYAYPNVDLTTYYSSTSAINVSSSSLLFVLGGKTAGGLSAFGPSFALAYNKNIKALTPAQLESYAYMQTNFLSAKPSNYVSSCVLSGQCSNETWYKVGWASTRTQPPDIYSLAPLATYRAINDTTIPVHLRSGYERYYLTNWGAPALCRRALSLLGL